MPAAATPRAGGGRGVRRTQSTPRQPAAAKPAQAAAKSAGQSLEEKLSAMHAQTVQDGVEEWAHKTGNTVPEGLLRKGAAGSGSGAHLSSSEMAQVSQAFARPYLQCSPAERALINKWLDGIGPMRHMGLMPGGHREECINRMKKRVVQQGEEIVQKGGTNGCIFFVLSGKAGLFLPRAEMMTGQGDLAKQLWLQAHVKVLSAENLPNHDGEKAGHTDPFVTVALSGLTRRTKTKYNTGTPEWGEQFEMYFQDGDTLEVTVIDDDSGEVTSEEDLVGTASVRLSSADISADKVHSFKLPLKVGGAPVVGVRKGDRNDVDGSLEGADVISTVTFQVSWGTPRKEGAAPKTPRKKSSKKSAPGKSKTAAAAAYGGVTKAKKFSKQSGEYCLSMVLVLCVLTCTMRAATKLHKLVQALEFHTSHYFGELEAFDNIGLMRNAAEPLYEYRPKDGKVAASVVASERCELVVLKDPQDVSTFKHCLQVATLDLVDRMLMVGQYGHVDEDDLSRLAVFGRERYLEPGEVVFMNGSDPEFVVMVLDGQLKGLAQDPGTMRQKTFQMLWKGSVVGEAEVLTGQPYRYTMVTETACELLYIHRFTYLANVPQAVAIHVRKFASDLTSGDARKMHDAYLELKTTGRYSKEGARASGRFRQLMAKNEAAVNAAHDAAYDGSVASAAAQ